MGLHDEPRKMVHSANGFPHIAASGAHKGNCLCLDTCCFGPNGCRCRGCAGKGHEGCDFTRARREQRASYPSSRGEGSSDSDTRGSSHEQGPTQREGSSENVRRNSARHRREAKARQDALT